MPKTTREIKQKKSPLLLILFLIIAAGASFVLFKTVFTNKKAIEPEEQFAWENQVKDIEDLTSQSTPEPPVLESAPKPTAEPEITQQSPCDRLSENLDDFFNKLNEQEYIAAYEIKEPLQDYTNKLIIKLLNNPPIIDEETDDLFTVLKNTAHFYRILGHKDLSLIKDILSYEQPNIEYLMGVFWEWSQIGSTCNNKHIRMDFPLPKLYEYAGFFLNTLGGQSYLFRRDSSMRVLIKYYCMLVLDQAVNASINKYNIDAASTLDSVIEDIENADAIQNQEMYLANLMQIKARLASSK